MMTIWIAINRLGNRSRIGSSYEEFSQRFFSREFEYRYFKWIQIWAKTIPKMVDIPLHFYSLFFFFATAFFLAGSAAFFRSSGVRSRAAISRTV